MKELPGVVPVSYSLQQDRDRVDVELARLLRFDGVPSGLTIHLAARDAVLRSGKRIRPILALRVARHLGNETQVCLSAAAAVELLHCASLVIDDLPCMDNAPIRRSFPAVHVVYGEAVAVLAALALISVSARATMIPLPVGDPWRERLLRFQNQLLCALDCTEMAGGQEMDLRLATSEPRFARQTVAERKTVPLFKLAVLAGCLDASPDQALLEHLLTFGAEFGQFYQSLDDYMDGCPVEPQDLYGEWQQLRAHCGILWRRSESLGELVESLKPPIGSAACAPRSVRPDCAGRFRRRRA